MESILCLFSTDPPRVCFADLGTLLHPDAEPQERAYPLGWKRIVLLGCCRGVLCVANVADGQVALWNPTAGNFNLWPPDATRIDIILGSTACVYGFGYDDEREEYVLLRLVQTLQSPILSAIRIYRPSDGGWSWLQRILPYYLVKSGRTGDYLHSSLCWGTGVYLHGSLHWIMRRNWEQNSAKVLVAFDLGTKRFEEMDHPLVDIDNRRMGMGMGWAIDDNRDFTGRMDLAVLGEQLCLTTRGEPRFEPGVVNVWIMREYGLIESWDHLRFLLGNHRWSLRPIRPIAYSQDGSQVLVEVGTQNKTLGWYNLNTNEVEEFQLLGAMPSYFDEATCLSLQVDAEI